MFERRCSVRGRWWRAGVAGATVPVMVLPAALAGAPAQAEPADMANQQYSKTTRSSSGGEGFHKSRMAELAEPAGVNVGHIHHYTESKEANNDRTS
jgi:hypothetical protein